MGQVAILQLLWLVVILHQESVLLNTVAVQVGLVQIRVAAVVAVVPLGLEVMAAQEAGRGTPEAVAAVVLAAVLLVMPGLLLLAAMAVMGQAVLAALLEQQAPQMQVLPQMAAVAVVDTALLVGQAPEVCWLIMYRLLMAQRQGQPVVQAVQALQAVQFQQIYMVLAAAAAALLPLHLVLRVLKASLL